MPGVTKKPKGSVVMPRFALLMQGHLVYIIQMMSFTQNTLNKLTPTYDCSAYTMTLMMLSASSDPNGHSGDIVNRLSAYCPCHDQQILPCISLPQHLPQMLWQADTCKCLLVMSAPATHR